MNDSGKNDSGRSSADLHHVQGVQHYVRQVGTVAEALSGDDDLTRKVIDAVHRGNGAAIEKLFAEKGVDSVVTISSVDGPAGDEGATGDTGAAMARTSGSGPRTKTITIEIGIGPFSVSVTVKKDSK